MIKLSKVNKIWIVAFYTMLLPACFNLTKPMDRPDAGGIKSATDTVIGPVMNTEVETERSSATSIEVSTNTFPAETGTMSSESSESDTVIGTDIGSDSTVASKTDSDTVIGTVHNDGGDSKTDTITVTDTGTGRKDGGDQKTDTDTITDIGEDNSLETDTGVETDSAVETDTGVETGDTDTGTDGNTDTDTQAVWRGGPCIATPDGVSWEVFGRGVDENMYRKTADTDWIQLTDLDGSVIDNRSDLDCSGTSTAVFITALGNQPLGTYLLATGFGSSYNQFQQPLSTNSYANSTAVSAGNATSFLAAGVSQTNTTVIMVSSGSETFYHRPTDAVPILSAPDITQFSAFTARHSYLVGFDDGNKLVLDKYTAASASQEWGDANLFASPGGNFLYSPTICHTRTSSGFPARHILAVTDQGLWYMVAESSVDDFNAWEFVTDLRMDSAPDCIALSDGTVMTVVVSDSRIISITGMSSGFAIEDLGVY